MGTNMLRPGRRRIYSSGRSPTTTGVTRSMCPPLFAAHRLNPPRDDRLFVKFLYAIIAIDGRDHPPSWLGRNNGYGSLLHFHGPSLF